MNDCENYYTLLAAAYVRGKLGHEVPGQPAFCKPIHELGGEELSFLLKTGEERGLRLHRFKRRALLPRVQKVLGMFQGLQPENLLDVGSGRGTFLWPLLTLFPALPVQCIDILDYRVTDLEAVRKGGVSQLQAEQMDLTQLSYANDSFDVTTLLEVLEHIPNVEEALKEACRVTKRFLILSVPSKEDENPEHLHLLDRDTLERLLKERGVAAIKYEWVLNHMIVLAKMEN